LCLFIDYSKAFDTVDPDLLLKDLNEIGICGPVLKLIENIIKNREIAVKIRDMVSEIKQLKCGVIQGGIISAKFFLIYVNGIFKILKFCLGKMFADDLLLIATHKDFTTAHKMLQYDFDRVLEWSHDRKLIINRKKTKSMHIYNKYLRKNEELKIIAHSNKCLHNFQISCNCDAVDEVSNYIYLGAKIDNNFN
jgi:hypothetical protein